MNMENLKIWEPADSRRVKEVSYKENRCSKVEIYRTKEIFKDAMGNN